MKKYYNYSIGFHWIVFLCFLLPFFYDSCAEKKHEEALVIDTASVVTAPVIADTILITEVIDTSKTQINVSTAIDSSKTDKDADNNSNEFISQQLSKKYIFLEPILIPENDVYSGIACIIDAIPFIGLFATFISFLFFITSLIVKFIDKDARKVISLLDIIALIFLASAARMTSIFGNFERRWGFWVCLFCATALTIYDLYIIKIQKAQKS